MAFGDRKKTAFHTKKRKPLKRTAFKTKTTATKATRGQKLASKRPNKQKRVKSLKRKLWIVFSQYIRKSYADHTGWLITVDGERTTWKECDCGHLWANTERNQQLGGNELWYYENNFAPQSASGNRFNQDDSAKKYMGWAIKKYGQEEVDRMYQMKQTPKKWTEEELEEKYRYYKEKFESL